MKLLRLAMRGVRSFTEPVEVDFERLGALGLFAIVGPTGAGKSTLLDGVFLALFGRSPRGEASECLAPGSRDLVVRLEIASTSEGQEVELAIERAWRFARRGEEQKSAAKSVAVRVERKVHGLWTPVDLGGRKPDAFVREAVVRVSMADFQQAVVLPQGAFDALLAARPAERRQLVASLFRTEHLGAPLNEVLKRRESEAKSEVDGLVEAEREVFVSEADARAARGEATRAATHARELAVALERAEVFVAQVRRAHERCAARDAARASLEAAELEAERRAIDRARASDARRASLAQEAVAELDVAEVNAAEADARDVEARREAHASAEGARAATKELAEARAVEARSAPEIAERLARARLALERREAADALAQEARARGAALALASASLARATDALATIESERAREEEQTRRLSAELDAVRVGEEERSLSLARIAAAELRAARDRASRARDDELEVARTSILAAEVALAEADAGVRELGLAADAAAEELASRSLDAARAIAEVEIARRALEEARLRGSAAALGATLRDGTPCPVCGAREHPGGDHGGSALWLASSDRGLEAALRYSESADRVRARAAEEAQARSEAHRAEMTRAEELSGVVEAARSRRARLASDEEIPRSVLEADSAVARAAARCDLALDALPEGSRQRIVTSDESLEDIERAASSLVARARRADALHARLRAAEGKATSLAKKSAELRLALDDARLRRERAAAEAEAASRIAESNAREAHALLLAVEPKRQGDLFGPRPPERDAAEWTAALELELSSLRERTEAADALATQARAEAERWALEAREARGRKTETGRALARARTSAELAIRRSGFPDAAEVAAAQLAPDVLAALEAALVLVDAELTRARAVLEARRRDATVEVDAADAAIAEAALSDARASLATASDDAARSRERADELARRRARAIELRARIDLLAPRLERIVRIRQVTAGGMLSELAAERHLEGVTRAGAEILRSISRERYALVRRADGSFAVSDGAHGGLVRPPSTLSGGEIFLASLALALALSERIQLAGRTRFDFFFLDEGFGSLDAATLDLALGALEALRDEGRVIGMISHVAAVEERMPRRLRVLPSRTGRHARLVYEP